MMAGKRGREMGGETGGIPSPAACGLGEISSMTHPADIRHAFHVAFIMTDPLVYCSSCSTVAKLPILTLCTVLQ